jgi:peptide-methionine (S)-S-oxide reductase
MSLLHPKTSLVTADNALRGRDQYPFVVPETHYVNGHRIREPFERADLATAVFGTGCFWGAEEIFWQTPGVWSTAVGYAGGYTPHPTYEEVCSGRTGHTEVVRVIYDPAVVSFAQLLRAFFESHDPTQGMRQGNDVGSQYRSAIYLTYDSDSGLAEAAAAAYSEKLAAVGYDRVTTEIAPLGEFFYAEGYHQQYLAKNPNGYRCHSATGVSFPVERFSTDAG